MDLDPAQYDAVRTLSGPLLVLAGAGTFCRTGPSAAAHKMGLSLFPTDGAAVNEERRLCYVGVTRAQRRLTLTLALSRRKWGKS